MEDKRNIVIACVAFETVMNVDPAVYYGADEVHLFHYVRPDSPSAHIYREFYGEVCKQLREKIPAIRIVEHDDDPVYDFQKMMRDLLIVIAGINEDYKGKSIGHHILINASSGTTEFSAAAIIAALMSENTSAFTVGTRSYTIPNDKVQELYYRDGRPVGLTSETRDPRTIPSFEIDKPEDNMVKSLGMYAALRDAGKPVTATSVIAALKNAGLWEYRPNAHDRKTDIKQKEIMYYQRHYIQGWVRYGWIEKQSSKSKYDVTEDGRNIILTFGGDLFPRAF